MLLRALSPLVATVVVGVVCAQTPRQPVAAKQAMVVCVSPPAAEVGVSILKRGGNAVDAAVAVAFVMAVTHPSAGNIGGGGFMLIHPPAGHGAPTVIEYREMAPAAATADMFAKGRDSYSHLAVGVPGTVRGLELAYQKYGSGNLDWVKLVEPAIEFAEKGWTLEPWSARSLNRQLRLAKDHTEFQRVFGNPAGEPWKAGDVLKQPDLARTLRAIAERGAAGFYSGEIAEKIEREMKVGNGLITKDDLAAYQAKERKPVHGTYRGLDVWTAPPPSGGGTVLVQMLNMLENFDFKSLGADTPARWHLMTEVMRRAYADRARYLGDADFVAIPPKLVEKDYAKRLVAGIDRNRATPSADLTPDLTLTDEPEQTTHFSIVDADGRAVANTYTLEDSYGSRIVVRGAGFLLNNEMNDFNPIPGVTTRKGKIGTAANLVAPHKRMLSSMTPTVLTKNGKPMLVTGSPGGRTIPNTVLCVVTNIVDFEMAPQAAVDSPRIHHGWFPDELRMERVAGRRSLVDALTTMGHQVAPHSPTRTQGDAHTIWLNHQDGTILGAADQRLMGKAAGY